METKKSQKADLENKRTLFIETGLIVALVVVLAAFEYKTYDKKARFLDAGVKQIIEEEFYEKRKELLAEKIRQILG